MKTTFLLLTTILLCGWWANAPAAEPPQAGQPAPGFTLPDQTGKLHSLTDYRGSWLVLYFYPKDDTPGCIKEACSFRDDLHRIERLGAKVVGISLDDTESHAKFARKYHLPFPLLSDHDGKVADRYGALTHLGIVKLAKRHTYLIGPDGKIVKVYLKVDPSRHSREIIDDLEQRLLGKHD
ncbi:MAG: peroxiredoxin [Methylophilaceae bacterium]|nr:peroxiredoxin [Methylophilaceae bacterium]